MQPLFLNSNFHRFEYWCTIIRKEIAFENNFVSVTMWKTMPGKQPASFINVTSVIKNLQPPRPLGNTCTQYYIYYHDQFHIPNSPIQLVLKFILLILLFVVIYVHFENLLECMSFRNHKFVHSRPADYSKCDLCPSSFR